MFVSAVYYFYLFIFLDTWTSKKAPGKFVHGAYAGALGGAQPSRVGSRAVAEQRRRRQSAARSERDITEAVCCKTQSASPRLSWQAAEEAEWRSHRPTQVSTGGRWCSRRPRGHVGLWATQSGRWLDSTDLQKAAHLTLCLQPSAKNGSFVAQFTRLEGDKNKVTSIKSRHILPENIGDRQYKPHHILVTLG